MKTIATALAVMGSVFACSGEGGDDAGAAGGGGSAAEGASAGDSPNSGGTTTTGGTGGQGDAGGAGESGASGAGGTVPDPVSLPEGSREYAGIVNLVDPAAAAELEAYLALSGSNLSESLNLFLKYYVEQYDFVYLFTDHELATTTAGRYVAVTHPAIPGTGWDYDVEARGYTTNGRTRGVIGIQFHELGHGPLGHEMVHHWGNFLGPEFGFGIGRDQSFGPHWGYTGFKGVLGGFDPATLHCEPLDCAPLADGRTRYRIGSFGTGGNDVETFAPLELYLMGLLPFSELPESIPILEDATSVEGSFDAGTRTSAFDASGLRMLDPAAIIEKLGPVTELPDNERTFSAAFVVISAAPATDAVLENIGARATTFGGRAPDSPNPSLSGLTGGRATLNTELGPRRTTNAPAPELRIPASCDLFAQDCDLDKACFFGVGGNLCGLTRGGLRNDPCTTGADCAPGLDCSGGQTSDARTCQPYCSADDSAPNACSLQCPWFLLTDEDGVQVAGLCQTL